MGRRRKHLHDDLRYYTDLKLVEIVRHGRPVFDGNGQPVFDAAGNQVYQPPSASDLSAAIKRLRDVGHIADDARKPNDAPLKNIVQQMREKGGGDPDDDGGGDPIAGRIPETGTNS
jgi:hypothetical protein